jgi:hypothetical protein
MIDVDVNRILTPPAHQQLKNIRDINKYINMPLRREAYYERNETTLEMCRESSVG